MGEATDSRVNPFYDGLTDHADLTLGRVYEPAGYFIGKVLLVVLDSYIGLLLCIDFYTPSNAKSGSNIACLVIDISYGRWAGGLIGIGDVV